MLIQNVKGSSRWPKPAKWFQQLWRNTRHKGAASWIDFYVFMTGDKVSSNSFYGGHVKKVDPITKKGCGPMYIAAIPKAQNVRTEENKAYRYDKKLAQIKISKNEAEEAYKSARVKTKRK
ncbi:MAG: hypothetical protein FWE97_03340 [Dehalococcoidia bacterium]|nr:hypothetical protein [Dehalococcoidia bacterium]